MTKVICAKCGLEFEASKDSYELCDFCYNRKNLLAVNSRIMWFHNRMMTHRTAKDSINANCDEYFILKDDQDFQYQQGQKCISYVLNMRFCLTTLLVLA